MRATVLEDKPRFILRDAADIQRLFFHLTTRWALPRVEFRIDGLASLRSQRAQDRFARLYGDCNCLIGELLGAATLLGGSYMVWVSGDVWSGLGWVVAATVCAALIGKLIELVWVRARLLLVLRDLRRRVAAGEEPGETGIAMIPVAVLPVRRALNPENDHLTQHDRIERRVFRNGPKRPSVLLRDAADIDSLVPRLARQWTLPRIEIRVDALPSLDMQRTQFRVRRFSGPSSYFPAALLATAILLGGLVYVIWTGSQAWYSTRADWWLPMLDWSDVQPVVIAALCAGLVGTAIEMIWMRVRLPGAARIAAAVGAFGRRMTCEG